MESHLAERWWWLERMRQMTWDEEVYGNDGAERHEAQEASAGDRRAIADADQAGQLDISGETRTASKKHYVLLNHTQTLREWHTTQPHVPF